MSRHAQIMGTQLRNFRVVAQIMGTQVRNFRVVAQILDAGAASTV
jgi:hypothetical protein